MTKSKKLLIIGLDGVSWNVLNPMIENGHMPFLRDFIRGGKSGILKSTEPPITPAAWTSFMTGLDSEEHDVRGFRNFQLKNGKFTYTLNNSSNIRHKSLWHILSENNKRVCIINLPLTYPPFQINGIMVSGFPVPVTKECEYTYPAEFKREILEEIPDYQPLSWGDGIEGASAGIEHFVKRMIQMTSQRAKLSLRLLGKEDWDCFMVHFQETDFVQHRFWHFIDKEHPDFSEEGFRNCAKYYDYLDKQLSDIVSIAGKKDFSVLFMSDHGFQRWEFNVKINNWLSSENFLHLNKNLKNTAIGIAKNVYKLFPANLKERFIRKKVKKDFTDRYLREAIDYDKTLVFVETNGVSNTAFAHLIGDSHEQVITKLLGLTAPDGSKLIAKISPYQNGNDIYKLLFKDGVTATGTIVTTEPWCSKPVLGKNSIVGIHHRDGIVISDNSFGSHNLPEKIHEVFDFVLGHLGITRISKACLRDVKVEILADKEQEQVEDSLRSLGYL
jgi:predicted AlkP superfamily phosphohydrolase/phosphomutase